VKRVDAVAGRVMLDPIEYVLEYDTALQVAETDVYCNTHDMRGFEG
jgi:hypothetical protein